MRAFITGVAGLTLTDAERAFLRDAQPWGLIVFARNVADPEQLRRLTAAFRSVVGRDAPVLVDQEGGRVQRLGPPHWPKYPPAAAYARLYGADRAQGLAAAALGGRLIAADLHAVGIDVDCAPVADIPVAEADPIIGDRAYGMAPEPVAALAGAFARGLMEGGVLPVVKHMPGHGRAAADSHKKLPVVTADRATLEATDFAAFRGLADLPMAMTAHVMFTAIDPIAPATASAAIVRDVIRGSIGFQGLLMCDDISMGALSGSLGERTRAVLAAGCDVALHCDGEIAAMEAMAAAAPLLAGEAGRRAAAALAKRQRPAPIDLAEKRAEFAALMKSVWEPAQGWA
ncbi:MAG TPA: beta-N-acetylhexosaminidase [Xanthobacteraceae bacterium]|jgi:beta-N-acetylhexosaminidase|nr:beta-N-acetylhexosaminidase [Xanthobacteraceae bacterium]